MIVGIHRIVIGSDHTIRTGASAVSINAICAGIKIAFDDQMKPYFGQNVVPGLELAVLACCHVFSESPGRPSIRKKRCPAW